MDAVWSSVVVVLAFTATFMAMESGNRVAVKDLNRTTAYDIAQDELANQRALGRRPTTGISDLLATNNTNVPPSGASRQFAVNGKIFRIWYQAYYVTGLGNNSTDACGGSYSANGQGAAKFIYIKVVVDYPDRTPGAPMPTLDEYFAPEGGDTNAATGTLRVYVLQPPNDDPYVGTDVTLSATGVGVTYNTTTLQTGDSGCVLFTGLPRGDYNIGVANNGKYDMYVNNPTGTMLNTPVRLPERSAMSKDIRMTGPVDVTPRFFTTDNNGNPVQVTPQSTNLTTGPPDLVGPWQARSSEIVRDSPPDFTTNPGTAFLPHPWITSPANSTNYMYPDVGGYDVFPGPCDVNAPTTLHHIPTLNNTTWGPGSDYLEGGQPLRFDLPRLKSKIWIQTPNNPSTPLVRNREVRNGSLGNGGARIAVRLIGAYNAPTAANYSECGPNVSMFKTWERLRGTLYQPYNSTSTTSSPNWRQELDVDDQVLPIGKYEVCMRAEARWESRTSTFSNTWSANYQTRYKSYTVDIGPGGYTIPPWDVFADLSFSTTDCTASTGGAAWSQ